jgi:lysophospholipase L1-like esterase
MKLIVFGDSVAYGAWDPQGGWVQRLRSELERKSPQDWIVYNCGVSGDTSRNLLKRFEAEAKSRSLDPTEGESAIVICIGGNDSATVNATKTNWVKTDAFRKNIAALIKKAKEAAEKVAFVGLTPVDEKRVAPCPFAPEISYKNSETKRYETIIAEECEKAKVLFLPLFETLSDGWNAMLEDGAHPNAGGHERICREVLAFLEKERVV